MVGDGERETEKIHRSTDYVNRPKNVEMFNEEKIEGTTTGQYLKGVRERTECSRIKMEELRTFLKKHCEQSKGKSYTTTWIYQKKLS